MEKPAAGHIDTSGGQALLSCLVFFVFQLNDGENRIAAEQYYFDSGLAEIEIPLYVDYLKAEGKTAPEQQDIEAMDVEAAMAVHMAMEEDAAFLDRLRDGGVIPREDPSLRYGNHPVTPTSGIATRAQRFLSGSGRPIHDPPPSLPTCFCTAMSGTLWAI